MTSGSLDAPKSLLNRPACCGDEMRLRPTVATQYKIRKGWPETASRSVFEIQIEGMGS